jgi:hypothetical protein
VRAFVLAGIVACARTASPPGSGSDDDPSTGGSGAAGGTAGTGVGGGSGSAALGGSAGVASGGATSGGSAGIGGAQAGDAGTGASGGVTGGAGSGANAGQGGTGGGDTAGSGGKSAGPCGHPGEVFCEDFEDATPLDPARWAIDRIGEGTVVIESAIAHSGTKSVHATEVGYNAFATLKGAGLFPAGSRFYLRVFMRLATPMTPGHNTYFIAGLAATPGAPYETRIGVQNSMLVINQPMGDRGFLSNQNFYNDGLPGAVLAVGDWSCVEVFFDPPNSTIDVWLDDEPIPDLSRTDWQQERFDVVRFGFERYAGPDSEIWYDDIALGTERIGCD